jgi:hypothetical protein
LLPFQAPPMAVKGTIPMHAKALQRSQKKLAEFCACAGLQVEMATRQEAKAFRRVAGRPKGVRRNRIDHRKTGELANRSCRAQKKPTSD